MLCLWPRTFNHMRRSLDGFTSRLAPIRGAVRASAKFTKYRTETTRPFRQPLPAVGRACLANAVRVPQAVRMAETEQNRKANCRPVTNRFFRELGPIGKAVKRPSAPRANRPNPRSLTAACSRAGIC